MSQQTINTPRDTTFKSTENTPRNIADVLVDELAGIAGAIGNIGSSDYDDLTHRPQVNSVTLTGNKSSADLGLASNSDLTNIIATGSTNTTGAKIDAGVFFYLNGTLVQAKVDIAVNAAFTLNTNYEEVTAGGLNSLNSNLNGKSIYYDQALTASGTFADINIDLTGYRYFMVVQEYNSTSMAIGFIYNIVGLASDEASNVAWSNNTLYSIGISMKIVSTSKMQVRLNSIGYGALTPNKTRVIGFK